MGDTPFSEPVDTLSITELERWRDVQGTLAALIDNPAAFDLYESRKAHVEEWVELAKIYAEHRIDPRIDIDISLISGAIYYPVLKVVE